MDERKTAESALQRLADRFAEIFRIFVKHADKLGRVTFWRVPDEHSWRSSWPVRGRTDCRLRFDRRLKPKLACTAIVSLVDGE